MGLLDLFQGWAQAELGPQITYLSVCQSSPTRSSWMGSLVCFVLEYYLAQHRC